jgi:hypothetical protein
MKRRTFLTAAGGAVLAAAVPTALVAPSRASAATALSRWGVCGHAPFIDSTAYPASSAAAQIELAASLGATDYRVDWQIPPVDPAAMDWSWYDTVVSTAVANGVELLCILTAPEGLDDATVRTRTAALVGRYAGRIPYYQLLNEVDNDTVISPDLDGTQLDHYDMAAYAPILSRMKAISAGVRDADGSARRVVNITWKHYGLFYHLDQDGLEYEVAGLDWYYGMDDMIDTLVVMNRLPVEELLITELDIEHGTNGNSEAAQADYLTTAIRTLKDRAPDKVHGVYVYELLDQPDWPSAKPDANQQHYGLVTVASDGAWGAHKQAFDTYRGLIQAG